MNSAIPHIAICVCTCRRPELLKRLLTEIGGQETGGRFTYSVVVADNDAEQTAKSVVADFAAHTPLSVVYCVETSRNIALARNQAVAHAQGSFIAFIDDDEFPTNAWLLNLFQTCARLDVSGVLAPVVSHYETEPPKWVRAGSFYDRPRHATGFKLDWLECRTGNVLFAKRILADLSEPFRTEFGTGGEDQDFFRRLMEKGHVFVWCDEAVVYETVPPIRWKRSFMLRRALLRGKNSIKHRQNRLRNFLKSVIAVPVYSLALPVLFIVGHHYFMRYLVKLADHTGRLLAALGVNVVRERPM